LKIALRPGGSELITGLFKLLSFLPLRVLHAAGAAFGQISYFASASLRREIRGNLAQAGYTDPALARAAAREAGKSMLELPFVWMRPQHQVLEKTSTDQWQLIEAARQAGRGIVFLTPHLGCFEITAQHFASRPHDGHPITVLYRPPRKAMFRPLIEGARSRQNLLLAPADLSGVKRLVRALRSNQAVGLLPDQVPSRGEGIFAPHFNRPAYTMTLPARLAEMSGATILLAWGERLPKGRGFIVHIVPFEETLSGSAEERAAQINRALETLIRRCPSQYLWGYRRYKVPRGVKRPA
jgi:KDO2-lipid IV(A) lauroyltransferase